MKLSARIYLAILTSLAIFLLAVALLGLALGSYQQRSFTKEVTAQFSKEVAPELSTQWLEFKLKQAQKPAIRPPHKRNREQYGRLLHEFAREHFADINIIAPSGEPIFHTGMGKPPRARAFNPLNHLLKPSVRVPLKNDFYADISTHNPHIVVKSFALHFALGLGVLFACVGLIAYPLTRRITGRLSTLTQSVDAWGSAGSASLELNDALLRGNDEIASLARSFHKAGARIEALIRANKLLLANASHEIRTPLTRIRLNLEMLSGLIEHSKQGDFAKREAAMKRNLGELDTLIDNILQSSRLEAQATLKQVTKVDLYALLTAEAKHFTGLLVQGGSARMSGDETLLLQVIRNLLNNAYKHGKPPVTASLAQDTQYIFLTVTDAGGCLPQDKLDVIFEPFQRLSNQSRGSGLGLHLVKQIIELHSGSISVTSDKSSTVFTVALPKTQTKPSQTTPKNTDKP